MQRTAPQRALTMDLLLPLVSLLLITGGGGHHVSFVDAATANSATPRAYWEAVLPGTPMPPAVSDLLAQREDVNSVRALLDDVNLKLIKGLRKIGPYYKKIKSEADRGAGHSHIASEAGYDLKEVSVSYGSKGGDNLKEVSVSYGSKDRESIKEVRMSYGVDDKDVPKRGFMAREGNIKDVSVSYGSKGGENLKEVSVSYGIEGKDVSKRGSIAQEGNLKEVSVSYGSDEGKDKHIEVLNQGEEDPHRVTMLYGAEQEDDPNKATMTYGSEQEEDPHKVTMSHEANHEDDPNKATMTYGLEQEDDPHKVTMSYGANHEDDPNKATMTYGSEQEDDPHKVTMSYRANQEVDPNKVTSSYGPGHEEYTNRITLSDVSEHEDDPNKATMSYGSKDEVDPNKATMSYKLKHGNDLKTVSTGHKTHIEGEASHHVPSHSHKNKRHADVFFFRDMLRPGSMIIPTIPPTTSLPTLLPRHIADSLPFSTKRLSDIIAMFAPTSLTMTRDIRWTLDTCEHPRNRQLEQQMEEKVREMVEMKQRSLAEDSQKTLEVLKDRERSLQDQLRQATESVKNMQKLHESAQSQLFELRTQSEEDRTAKEAEVSLLMDEVERAQSRLVSLEREKGDLRSQLQTTNEDTSNNSDYMDPSDILESSLIAKEKIISELNAELRNVESTLSSEKEMHVNELKKLTALLSEKETVITELKKELQERPTARLVDDLKKKVQILQAVGYNSIEAEDWELATNGEEMSKLEALLLDKNRKMEHELTQLKVKISEKSSLLEEAEKKIAELTSKVEEQKKLILKLEDDILKGCSSTDRRSSLLNDWDLQEIGSNEVSEGTDPRNASPDQDQSSMLKVICNQRDRFRTRLRETEEELRRLKEKHEMLAVELEKTKADNVQLYGKIRYVQDYSHEKIVSRGPKKYAEDIESGSSDVETKYKKMYEDDINPFAAFSRKEKDQRYKELGIRDKITLSSGRFLLGNKFARTFIFFYTIGLHLLVFTLLYRMSALSYLSITPAHDEIIVDAGNQTLSHTL